jgi:UDP-sulfoquinovose synthase
MQKTILILGGDGYFGWPLAMKIAVRYPQEKVIIIDNEWKRNKVSSIGKTLIPVPKPAERIAAFSTIHNQHNLRYINMDVNSGELELVIRNEKPHTIFHLAQQSSARYSMKGMDEALYTITNNETASMRLLLAVGKYSPASHIIKLGTNEGYFRGAADTTGSFLSPEYNDKPSAGLTLYTGAADDIYHIAEINNGNYAAMACRQWNLRITDIMQPISFGIVTDEMRGCEALYTRYDYDRVFGTVLNRILVQVVYNYPIHAGNNRRTGIMTLRDSVSFLACMVENMPGAGQRQIINQATETNYSINEFAETIKQIAGQATTGSRYALPSSLSATAKEMLDIIVKFRNNISPDLPILSEHRNEETSQAYDTNTNNKTDDYDNTINYDDREIHKTAISGQTVQGNEAYWQSFRKQYFQSERINLNPGTLGTTSSVVKSVFSGEHSSKFPDGFPLNYYEQARQGLESVTNICAELWPSEGYKLSVSHSTSQTMNLVALSILRKLQSATKGPYKVLTTTHEHDGGSGCFDQLPEFVVHCVTDEVLADPQAMSALVAELQPDVAFFSHVFYDTGNIAPVELWSSIVKDNAPQCKIILDVAQSIGLYDLPFGHADLILGSTHKWLYGPHGGGLMWMTTEFRSWIEGMYWSTHSLAYSSELDRFSIPGGQDFKLYSAIEESLKLYKLAGKHNILARSAKLGSYFQEKLDELLYEHNIDHVFLNDDEHSPVISIAFPAYDAAALYKYLNEQHIHTKLIKEYKIAGVAHNLIRIGIPYFESVERLDNAYDTISKYLINSAKATPALVPVRKAVPKRKFFTPTWSPKYNVKAHLN